MSQVEAAPTPEYSVPPRRAGAPMESPTVAIASGAVPAVAGLGSAALLAGGTAAGSAALKAAVWSSGIGAAASLIGLGVNTWMSVYAMKEQRKEARRAEKINTKRYKDAVRTDEYRYERGQRLQEAEFAANQKWATLDRREKAKAALRDAMLQQPALQQQLFNYNRMYRRS